jgi:ElaB/YqjD/DUF883 family membrane-anchored ribosome-binding protein
MSHAEQLERETEQTRTQIANTLDELRACMTPGHVLDQLADRVSDGATAAFAQNLKHQTVNNPLPVVLIGAGLAWLMLGPRGSSAGDFMRGTADHLRNATNEATDTMRSATDAAGRTPSDKSTEWSDKASRLGKDTGASLSSATERAKQAAAETGTSALDSAGSMAKSAQETTARTADSIRDTAGSMADSVQRSASERYDAIADGARRTASSLSESTKAARQRTLQTGSAFVDLCREQPLIVTGLGIAVGAMIGALLPATETEDRLMGETSDRVKDRAQDLASEQYENAKEVGEHALKTAQDQAVKATKQQEGGSEDAVNRAKSHEATLVPDQTENGEWRGQPWKPEDAPL